MRSLFAFALLSFVVPAAFAGPMEKWQEQVAQDVLETATIEAKVKAGDRRFCPAIHNKDMSSCFKAYLRATPVRSSAHFSALAALAPKVAAADQARGYDKTTTSLMMIDNVVSLIEKVDLTQLKVSRLRPAGIPELFQLAKLRRDEEASLNRARSGLIATLKAKQAEVDAHLKSQKRTVATVAWQMNTRDQLKRRVASAERLNWQYPLPLKEVRRDDVGVQLKEAAKREICGDNTILGCAQVSQAACGPLADQAFLGCNKQLEAKTPAILRDPASADPYLTALGQCGTMGLLNSLKASPKAQRTPQCTAIFQ